MAFDNAKHDIQLNNVNYRIKDYNKSALNAFVPRIGGGDQKETDFSMLRSKTLNGFSGGQLQRNWLDDTSFYASEGLFPIYEDGSLYPVNEVIEKSDSKLIGSSKAVMTAYCIVDNYLYVAYRTLNTPTNSIRRIDTAGTSTVLTLPASLSSASYPITSMISNLGKVYISTGSGSLWYVATSSTTVTDITGGSGYVTLMVVYKGDIYGTAAAFANNRIYKYTGNTTTKSWLEVGNTGQLDTDYYANLVNYAGRIFLFRGDGMWAYDGIQLLEVERSQENPLNYMFPVILKGYLYYFMTDGFYRFNGSSIEKVFDRSEIGFPVDVQTGKNRIWFLYRNSDQGSTRIDRLMGYDYSSGNNVDGRIAAFNGEGLYTYGRTSTFVKNPGTDDVQDQGAVHKCVWFNDTLFISNYYEKTIGNLYYTIDTDELAASGQKEFRLITSIFDGDFPQINKSLENIEIVLDGNISNIDPSDTISLSYRTENFDAATGWNATEDFIDTPDYKIQIVKTEPDGVEFRNVQFKLSGQMTAGYGLKQLITRYLLAPMLSWDWQMTLLCYGDSTTEPLVLADNTNETTSVAALRGNIYRAAQNTIPIKYLDIDQLNLNGDITAASLSIALYNIDLLKDAKSIYGDLESIAGYVQIDDEIIAYSDISSGAITVAARGVLGTTAAAHTSGAKVYPVYRVKLEIVNERMINHKDGELASQKSRPTEITIALKEV